MDVSPSPNIVPIPPLYKFLRADLSSPTGSGKWTKGRWRSVRGELVPCVNGLHCATSENLIPWMEDTLWRVEIGDEYVWHGAPGSRDRKLVARRMRIVDRVEAWNERTARLFAADCAERVLPLYEAKYPGDKRPRQAIETARRYANGEATLEELNAAATASANASASANATYTAAYTAAYTASASAYASATYTAAYTASASAYASATECEWQNRHLCEMLGIPYGEVQS